MKSAAPQMLAPSGPAHTGERSRRVGPSGEAQHYFGDVLDQVRRVEAMVSGLREVLTSVFEFSDLMEQQRTGAITRQLAAWARPSPAASTSSMNGVGA